MDAVEALVTRRSPPALSEPGPNAGQLDSMLNSGLNAPDHGKLRPWKFLVIRGDARKRFGDLLADSLKRREPMADAISLDRERAKALRAPVLIVVAAVVMENHKIPVIEQVTSAAAATQNILVAAHAMGFGGFWRTGAPAYDDQLKAGLGLKPKDTVVGILYIGNKAAEGKPLPPIDRAALVTEWTGA
jgi:nitroreductase